MLDVEKIKRRFLMVFIPTILVGFFYSISIRKNVGPTNNQLALMKEEMRWLKQDGERNIVTYAEGEVSKSGLAYLYAIIEPTYWRQPSSNILEAHGWAFYSEGEYCKYGVKLTLNPSAYKNKNAISIRMTYDEKSVEECRKTSVFTDRSTTTFSP